VSPAIVMIGGETEVSDASAVAVPLVDVFPARSVIVAVMTANGGTSTSIPDAILAVVHY
jgi:hypothetical protein